MPRHHGEGPWSSGRIKDHKNIKLSLDLGRSSSWIARKRKQGTDGRSSKKVRCPSSRKLNTRVNESWERCIHIPNIIYDPGERSADYGLSLWPRYMAPQGTSPPSRNVHPETVRVAGSHPDRFPRRRRHGGHGEYNHRTTMGYAIAIPHIRIRSEFLHWWHAAYTDHYTADDQSEGS